jgi:hypothetical protein
MTAGGSVTEKSLLYQENLGGAGDRDRTGMASLEGWGSAIELHPRVDRPRHLDYWARPGA